MSEDQLPDAENPHAAEFAVLEALKAEVEVLKDQRLRALAEVENIRRRADKEKADASQYAVTKFARDMVAIADNFARAIVDVVQSGFMIGDRLLRPAMVTVAKKDLPAEPVSVDTKA